jgi:hypothetical protein
MSSQVSGNWIFFKNLSIVTLLFKFLPDARFSWRDVRLGVALAETGSVDHEQPPPHRRTHLAEHHAKLIDRKGRRAVYPRHTYCLESDPRESPALHVSCGLWRLLLNYFFTMLIRTIFVALPALAIAISGYAQVSATVAPPQRNGGPGGK